MLTITITALAWLLFFIAPPLEWQALLSLLAWPVVRRATLAERAQAVVVSMVIFYGLPNVLSPTWLEQNNAPSTAVLLLVGTWPLREQWWWRVCVAVVAVPFILLADFRGAWLALFAAVGFWLWAVGRLRGRVMAALAGAAALVMLWQNSLPQGDHADITAAALELWLRSPLWGAGPLAFSDHWRATRDGLHYPHAHNIYLHTLAQYGVVGAAVLTGGLAHLARVVVADGSPRRAAVLIAALILNMGDMPFTSGPVLLTFVMMIL